MTCHNSCDHGALERTEGTEAKNTSQQYHSTPQINQCGCREFWIKQISKIFWSPVGKIHSVSAENSSDVGIWKHTIHGRLLQALLPSLTHTHTHSCAHSHNFTHSASLANMWTICSRSRQALWFNLQCYVPFRFLSQENPHCFHTG